MKIAKTSVAGTVLLGVACMAGSAGAHEDDPKALPGAPVYWGPGLSAHEGADGLGGSPFSSVNVDLKSWVPISSFPDQTDRANDCWGYTSPAGREYAIIGLSDGTGFVDVTNPTTPVVVETIPGLNSVWRDIKTFGTWAYAVTEATGGGIQVIDLSGIDGGDVDLVTTVTTGGSTKSHNVAIDTTSGFLYRAGGAGNGIRIYDINGANASSPLFVGEWNTRYCHDVQVVTYTDGPYAGKQIAFVCGGFNNGWVETGLDILDVTDKQNIIELSRVVYKNGAYSHQAWLSEDRQYLYLNDELDEDGVLPTTTHIFDVSDLSNPLQLDTFTNGSLTVGHNLYVRGNYVFEANYASGMRVFDATNPTQPVEVAWYDTHPDDNDTNYDGLWSVYPFFDSGTVIGSDRQRGLFVLALDLPKALVGDVNGDGMVGFADVLDVIGAWGPCPAPPDDCVADVDGSLSVDFADILMIIANWTT